MKRPKEAASPPAGQAVPLPGGDDSFLEDARLAQSGMTAMLLRLPDSLKQRVVTEAARRTISTGARVTASEIVRDAIALALRKQPAQMITKASSGGLPDPDEFQSGQPRLFRDKAEVAHALTSRDPEVFKALLQLLLDEEDRARTRAVRDICASSERAFGPGGEARHLVRLEALRWLTRACSLGSD